MAKFSLEFVDLTGTVDSAGKSQDKVSITMDTGDAHKEAFCYYNVPYKCTTITTDPTDEKKPPKKETDSGTGPVSFAFNIQNARFEKKMYSPNEIYALIQIAPGTAEEGDPNVTKTYDNTTIPKDDLEKSFINKKAVVTCDEKEVCADYYVQEINPTYKKGVMYVTFKMYSPDYQLTQEEYCRTFVSKKLGAEILTEEIKNYKLPFDSSTGVAISCEKMKHIKLAKDSDGNKAGVEHIFPYLVQYNESFYDFLKRTTNRWGEFLYYEDKKLLVGYGYAAETETDYKDLASSVTYRDLTNYKTKQNNAGQYYSEAPIDSQILKNDLTKGEYDIVKTRMNSIIPSNYKDLDGDIYVVKKLAGLLNNDKTVFQFLIDNVVDDFIDLEKANKVSGDKNDVFDNYYFNEKNKSETEFKDVQYDGDKFNQFSEYKPFLDTDKYINIVAKEFASGRNAIELDFDTTYPNIKLGQVITYDTKSYLVVNVVGYQPEKLVIVNDDYVEKQVETNKFCCKVIAVPQSRVESDDTTYYPPVIPEGHVRRSGPQLATVTEGTKEDPLRYNRVRIKYDWQSKDEWSSPWLQFTPGGGKDRSGVYSWHLKDQRVLVDYVAGNIERPYVVGSVVGSKDFKMPAQMKTYQQVFQTPWEQKILMTDGAGAGATAMLASFNPGLKLLQGFWPTGQLPWMDFEKTGNLEGNIEMTDKYGFYSIKGSTNDRNITIKSPWGDVKISAFTGITLSAPNGDVTIKGKNVKIEAGGNLTLTSGKNIKQKWWMDGEDYNSVTLATTAAKLISSKIASLIVSIIDISLLRHIAEVAARPVEGKLQITAGRYLMLEAGKKTASYPIDGYVGGKKKDMVEDHQIMINSFRMVKLAINNCFSRQRNIYLNAKSAKNRIKQKIDVYTQNIGRGQYVTNDINAIIDALWNNPSQVEEAAGCKDLFDPNKTVDDIVNLGQARVKQLGLAIVPGWDDMFAVPEQEEDPDPYAMVAQFFVHQELPVNMAQAILDKMKELRNEFYQEIRTLALQIKDLKNLKLPQYGEEYQKFNSVMVEGNLLDGSLLKGLDSDDQTKHFECNYPAPTAQHKLQQRRKLFIALVNSFGIPRVATEIDPLGVTPAKVFPEPAYDCSNEDWIKYVRSIQVLKAKKNKTAKEAFFDTILDPFKKVNPFEGEQFVKPVIMDKFAYGHSKTGGILFATSEGTMVLDKHIYRANVGGLENYEPDVNQPRDNGSASNVRNIMLQD